MKKLVIFLGLAATVTAGYFLVRQFAFSTPKPSFRFATVEKGDLQSVVSATGALNAVTTVSVGTQVSGQVSELLADFNSEVKKGQLLARIDPTLAQQGVADAQASIERLKAQTNQAQRDQDRNLQLRAEGLIPQNTLELTDAALRVAKASEKSADIALQRARQNLSYTSIHAPIDGVVVERNVNNGQTVAASLSAPQLFLIANDLTRMQILAQVGESDIAQIKQDQAVKFTVQALPGQTFHGTVRQVRLQSTTVDNVVNYTVVVAVENPERKLLPGMTARVDFQVKAADNILKVPNAALRYRPSEEVLAEFGPLPTLTPRVAASSAPGLASASPDPSASPDANSVSGSDRRGAGRRAGGGGDRAEGASARPSFGTLYYLGPDNKLKAARARLGISDGISTEVEGREVTEGMKVIVGVASTSTAASTTANPLSPTPQRRGPGGPGGF
ncbi:MAG: efflux RND transporter periplasmic adaptor subunit [Vicinamibacteria bacterium]